MVHVVEELSSQKEPTFVLEFPQENLCCSDSVALCCAVLSIQFFFQADIPNMEKRKSGGQAEIYQSSYCGTPIAIKVSSVLFVGVCHKALHGVSGLSPSLESLGLNVNFLTPHPPVIAFCELHYSSTSPYFFVWVGVGLLSPLLT